MRTLTTGAAALLIAAIVGVLALTGASAQESEPPTPGDLYLAQVAFRAEVDSADADVDVPKPDRADGIIVINGVPGPDSLERALEWLEWQEGRAKAALPTLAALQEARSLKAVMDATEEACIAAYGVCAWARLAPAERGDATVSVLAVRLSASSWTVRIVESGVGPHGEPGLGTEVTVKPTTTARVVPGTAHTLSNGTRVAVVVDKKRDTRVEFAIIADTHERHLREFTRDDTVAFPDLRFAPGNTRHGQTLLSSPVSIAYTPTAWLLQGDGS